VEIYINHSLVASALADAQGRWTHPVDLPDGTYKIQARAKYGSLTSPFSRPVKVVVDESLVWSPLSLRFISQTGHVVLPKDESGFMGEDGWFVFLRPGVTYTVTVYSCCGLPNAEVTLALPDGQVIELENPDDDNWYVGVFTMPQDPASLESSSIILCVFCGDAEYCSEGEVLIDPEGVVFDVDLGKESGLLADAVVACYEKQIEMEGGGASQSLWPADSYDQVNPQTTAADGYFSFYTPAGVYQLDVTREGYQPYRSWDLVVVAEPVEFNVPLTPETSEVADHTILVSESGYEPSVLTVASGDIIEWINIGDEIHTTSSTTPTTHLEGLRLMALGPTDGWDSGLLGSGDSYKRRLTAPGSYTYHDHENTAYTGLVVVEGETLYLPIVMRGG
jgi:plastocyanin